MEITERPVKDLLPYSQNARTHSDAQVAQIVASIEEFGWTNPVLVDGQNGVIAGHGRLLAALRMGRETVPCIEHDHMTAEQQRAYIIADNRLAENAGWDKELLALELGELGAGDFDLSVIGFDVPDLEGLLAFVPPTVGLTDPDYLPDERPVITLFGDVWILGRHRLVCGDNGKRTSVLSAMADATANLTFTSPPYKALRDYTDGPPRNWSKMMRSMSSHLSDVMESDGQCLVNLGLVHENNEWMPYWDTWLRWMRRNDWRRFGLYVWDQGPGMPGHWAGRLAPAFELIFHFNREARKPNKTVECALAGQIEHAEGDRPVRSADGTFKKKWSHGGAPIQAKKIPDSVVRITRQKGSVSGEGNHPAPFPVKLAEELMLTFTDPGEVVYDPFVGSGTTIIAAEMTGRQCRAIDIGPPYVDLAVRRWQEFTGEAATLDGDGRTFDQIALERQEAA